VIQVSPENVPTALRLLTGKLGVKRLSTITGLDVGDGIGLDYQFSESNRIIAIRTIVPKTSLRMESCTTIIPGAILYEMEIHDMFGVVFQGNPWMDRKLLLPDNYPADMPPPLLKTTSTEKIRKAVGLEK
jgi:NADH:ubiquinone oxidoreductase subunit C